MIPIADRARHAARNNADHYQAMFEAHGLAYRRDADLFRALAPPLPYHSAALVLQPGDPASQISAIAGALAPFAGGAGVKDGFARLDLRVLGLEVGFRAQWIWAETAPHAPNPGSEPGWEIIGDAAGLARWERAWQVAGSPVPAQMRMFPPGCLAGGKLIFCGRRCGAGFDAGCVLNRSGDIIGLSNLFGPEDEAGLFAAALAMAQRSGNGRPVTGYERGAALDAALAAGFEAAGPLVVWFPASGA